MLDYQPNIVLSNQEYQVVGKRPIRHDGAEKVTGYARYGADTQLPGMLYGKILRSPHTHARIKSVDTRHAEELPGVHAVVTSTDVAQPSGSVVDLSEGMFHNMRFLRNNILAADKVLYKGHAIAAVAATSPHIAEEALSLIQVDYEALPAVLNAADAMKDSAALLHERLATMSNPNLRPGGTLEDDDSTVGSNLANHFEFRLGDVDKGFQEADVIVEKETATAPIHQGYIEPHSATAMWHSDGTLTIWSSSQGHFNVREQTARLLDVPISKVKAIPMEIGGGFGAKTLVYVEPVAAALARKAGHPVKVTMSRTEVFEGTGPTSGTNIRVKLGATKDGRLVAAEAHLIYEAGAYPGSPVSPGCQCMMAAYDIPNAWIEGYDVVVNRPKSAAYRAPGSPSVGDTDSVGFTSITGGSGVTFKTGWAAYEAAQDIKRQMQERAAKIWDCPVEQVAYQNGVLQHTSDAELRLPFKQLAARQNATGGPIMASIGLNPAGAGPSIAVHIVDVEVDPDTGKVSILRYTAVQDAGKAIHPSYVEGQMQGGVVQGIGWALNEEYTFNEEGHMLNSSFLDYRMPTSLDLPMIDTVIVEVPNPSHPYGVRGVGEVPIVPPMAAISNAIYRAIGVRLNQLPMSPGRILETLWARKGATNHK